MIPERSSVATAEAGLLAGQKWKPNQKHETTLVETFLVVWFTHLAQHNKVRAPVLPS